MAVAGPSGASGSSLASKEGDKYYDKMYFDSDEEEDSNDENNFETSGSGKKQNQREVKSNDDLMYDPDMDDEDEAWIDNIRRQYQSKFKT